MFSRVFPSFSAPKSAARTSSSQPKPAQPAQPSPTPSKKPSRLQKMLQALHLSRSHSKVDKHRHQPQVVHISSVSPQRPSPTMLQTTSRSVSAEPSPSSTPSSFTHSTFSAAGAPQLTPSASITPATTFSNPPAASGSNYPVLTADPAAASKRIADLKSAVHQLNRDNVRQISSTNELLNNKLFGQMIALVEERDGDKAARKAAEDRLAEVVASRATAEKVLLKEREERRKAKSAWSQAYYALEKENTDLQAALLDMQAKTDLLQVEALQEALGRLGIVDPDDQQYPLAYPVCGDCTGPFLKAVCMAARKGPQARSNGGPEHELATAAHRTFEAPSGENGCLELVSDKRTGTRSSPPAPAEWLKSRTRRLA